MSSIGPNIPSTSDELHISGKNQSREVKKSDKQLSTAGIALKALEQFKSGLSKIDLSKHLGNLKQLSDGLNKLSMSLFNKLFTKSKKSPPDLMLFDEAASFRKKEFSEALKGLVKSRDKSQSSINLMDQDLKEDLSKLQKEVQEYDSQISALNKFVETSDKVLSHSEVRKMEETSRKLNEHLSQISLHRKLSGSSEQSLPKETSLPKVRVSSEQNEPKSPLSPKFQINQKNETNALPSPDTLKEAASKLKLGTNFKAEHKEFLEQTKIQLEKKRELANQVKKQLNGTQEMIQTAHDKGVINELSKKEIDKIMSHFDKVNQKTINTLNRAQERVEDWTIFAHRPQEDKNSGLDAEKENFIENLLDNSNDGAIDISPKRN